MKKRLLILICILLASGCSIFAPNPKQDLRYVAVTPKKPHCSCVFVENIRVPSKRPNCRTWMSNIKKYYQELREKAILVGANYVQTLDVESCQKFKICAKAYRCQMFGDNDRL